MRFAQVMRLWRVAAAQQPPLTLCVLHLGFADITSPTATLSHQRCQHSRTACITSAEPTSPHQRCQHSRTACSQRRSAALREARHIACGDGVAAKDDKSLNHVTQFSDIAWPAFLLQCYHCTTVKHLHFPSLFVAYQFGKVIY